MSQAVGNATRTFTVLLWTLAGLALVVDLATKYILFAQLEPQETWVIIPNLLNFTRNHLNQGALFGLGGDLGHVSNYAFAGFSAVAILFIAYWTRRPEIASDGLLMTALGLILGGAAGNLYDRLMFGGVRDFIWVKRHFPDFDYTFNFAVFNIADSCLVIGACLLFLHTLIHWRSPAPATVAEPQTPPATNG